MRLTGLALVMGALVLGCQAREPDESPDAGGAAPGGAPAGGVPAGGEPAGGAHAGGEPSGGAPAGGEPSGGAPVGGAPTGGVAPPVDPCSLPPESGTCEAAIARWYFNPATSACAEFVYGGCDGNANNFETREACEAACGPAGPPPPPPRAADADADGLCDEVDAECNVDGGPALCDLDPPECPAGSVAEVTGGCYTLRCVAWADCGRVEPPVDACTLPPESGECDAAFPRWYFDAATGECAEFLWGGCGGNANNFETREACQATCGAAVPPPPPPCADADADGLCDDVDNACNPDGTPLMCRRAAPPCPGGTVPEVRDGCYTDVCLDWSSCFMATPIAPCGGFAGLVCLEGLVCEDLPDDGCDPATGGADCPGRCVSPR